MAIQSLIFATLLMLAYESHAQGNSYSKAPKQLLNCMAKCIDYRLSRELESCGNSFPIGVQSGIRGGRRRRVGIHMVSMTKEELMKIVNCVAQSRNPIVQSEFDVCNEMQPAQTLAAFNSCAAKIVGVSEGRQFYDAMAAESELVPQIFECVRENTVDYTTTKETDQQVSFENCARQVYSEACGRKTAYY